MKKYLFLYSAPATIASEWKPSPAEMEETFRHWQAWKEKFKAQVVDVGDGLHPSGPRLVGDQRTDGPFPEAKEIVNGYSIVQAATLDEALRVARECPIKLMPGAIIDIREMMGY